LTKAALRGGLFCIQAVTIGPLCSASRAGALQRSRHYASFKLDNSRHPKYECAVSYCGYRPVLLIRHGEISIATSSDADFMGSRWVSIKIFPFRSNKSPPPFRMPQSGWAAQSHKICDVIDK
jgi:hypothetical protein